MKKIENRQITVKVKFTIKLNVKWFLLKPDRLKPLIYAFNSNFILLKKCNSDLLY